jgi:hypothetical protein
MMISQYRRRLLLNDVFEAVFGMVGLLLAFIEYDNYFHEVLPEEGSDEYDEILEICIKYNTID